MRSSDKLIRQKCPSCRAEITLGSSSLNKKIQCPKCRQAVIIPGGESVPGEPVSNHVTIVSREFDRSQEAVMPIETLPIQTRYPSEETQMPGGNSPEDEREPVVYCLCNGVLKKRIISKEWGPARSVCCMSSSECSLE